LIAILRHPSTAATSGESTTDLPGGNTEKIEPKKNEGLSGVTGG
jgi:hypothetical protein